MADYLKNFKEGEDIKASETNSNNQFLLDKISDNNSAITQYLEGELGKINSTISSGDATLQNNINNLSNTVDRKLEASMIQGGNGYCRLSNGLIIQWGYSNLWQADSRYTNIFYPIPFSGQYTYRVTVSGLNGGMSNDRSSWIISQSATGCIAANAQGGIGQNWIAIGT